MPEAPEAGLLAYAHYFVTFLRARFQRRAEIRALAGDIKAGVAQLDSALGDLGRAARARKLELRQLSEENRLIDAAEARREAAVRALSDLAAKLADENSKFAAVEADLTAKLTDREGAAKAAAAELEELEAARRTAREGKKALDRRQRDYIKGAEAREAHAAKAQMGDARASLRKSAEEMRRDAAMLDPERKELERTLAALETPLKDATALFETTRGDVDATRRALDDARAGHRHRLAELDDQKGHQTRETTEAGAEILRRLVTLGTILNLNRVVEPELAPLYERIDTLRSEVTAREKDVERLEAERRQYQDGALIRGGAVIGGAFVLLIALVCVVIALLSRGR